MDFLEIVITVASAITFWALVCAVVIIIPF